MLMWWGIRLVSLSSVPANLLKEAHSLFQTCLHPHLLALDHIKAVYHQKKAHTNCRYLLQRIQTWLEKGLAPKA